LIKSQLLSCSSVFLPNKNFLVETTLIKHQLDLYWCLLGFDLIKSWLLVNNWYKSRLDQMVAHGFDTWSVLWNWHSIYSYEGDLVKGWLLVINWHKSWSDQVVAHRFGTWSTLKAKSHWDSCDWLYQNTGLALTQSLLYRNYTALILRVCSEVCCLGFNLDFLDVCHWGVGSTCQWKMITWMTPQEISFFLLNLLSVIHVEWTADGEVFIPLTCT
jgi:hypothetical protein